MAKLLTRVLLLAQWVRLVSAVLLACLASLVLMVPLSLVDRARRRRTTG